MNHWDAVEKKEYVFVIEKVQPYSEKIRQFIVTLLFSEKNRLLEWNDHHTKYNENKDYKFSTALIHSTLYLLLVSELLVQGHLVNIADESILELCRISPYLWCHIKRFQIVINC